MARDVLTKTLCVAITVSAHDLGFWDNSRYMNRWHFKSMFLYDTDLFYWNITEMYSEALIMNADTISVIDFIHKACSVITAKIYV